MKLKSLEIISSNKRNASIDVFRAFAILSVVVFHFNMSAMPHGLLGVDLFFVISGLLIGGILTKDFKNGKDINFFKFFLQRGFKIWPSYFACLIFGNLLAFCFYKSFTSDQFIPISKMGKFVFFYLNYTGNPFYGFYHLWSLCVEEHFYILLPILYIILQQIKFNKKALFFIISLIILAGILFKVFVFYFTNSKETYAATHNRIDALAWGVLLNLIIFYFPNLIRRINKYYLLFLCGLIIFLFSIIADNNIPNSFYTKVVLHSVVPFSFFLMIAGLYYFNFTRLKALKFIAYYSYNWYLWHPIVLVGITHFLGYSFIGFISYILLSFIVALVFTIFIEEPLLRKRNKIIQGIFSKKAHTSIEPIQV